MSDAFELEAKVRTDLGKGASRRLRRLNNEIPAVVYGGDKEPLSITLSHNEMLHATENEAFFSHIITLKVGNDSEQVIIKDLQRHPARPFLMHADFQRIKADEEITVHVPIHFLNEDKCKGHKLEGGIVNKILTDLEVSCLPGKLPEYLEVDLLELHIGDSLHISDMTLPEGVTSVALAHGGDDADSVIVTIMAPRAVEEETTEEGEEPEAPAAGAGEEESDED
ncbi:MAG: 50S ribosomal protein L25/general stress protein Ctc [Pseudomonadales bacterium]|nr:50S ribosomal protein L25/general stress protein Ctc [Pseudomonadales bacterium]MCP5345243.1 50S ribosomal protein L25/general stress protein Ctc [Pseudomonadales bacterium]